jgi:hypothetical protein
MENWRCFCHSVYADGKPQVDFVWNRFALIHPRSEEKFIWPSSKHVPSRVLMPQPAKTEISDTEHNRFGLLDPKTKTARAELFSKGLYSLEFQVHGLIFLLYS